MGMIVERPFEVDMIKSELIASLAAKMTNLPEKQVTDSINEIINVMSQALVNDSRIEIRGFGSFSNHLRPSRQTRNPKTGATVFSEAKKRPHFKPGKELRERVNVSRNKYALPEDDD